MNCTLKIVTAILIIVFAINGEFEYRHQYTWPQRYKSCAGKLQSPIALPSKAKALLLPALETVGYHDFLPKPVLLKNNGHAVELNFNKQLKTRVPYIFGASLKTGEKYELEGVHFHWGAKNNRGSEHTLNGVRFPMEMHMVHRNTRYSNTSEALNHEDGLCVLGIFFQLQEEDNDLLHPILNSLENIRWVNEETQISISITLASFMPRNVDTFYIYKGSLTTPPCSEVVMWIIFPTAVPISSRQMNKFRKLSTDKGILADTYRLLQKIGRRKIYVRKLSPFLTSSNTSYPDVTDLNWFWQ